MSVKHLSIPDIGEVALYKRRGMRAINLRVQPNGVVRITLPAWAPYRAGIEFALSRQQWIETHRPSSQGLLANGVHIGKAHRLFFAPGASRTSFRIINQEIIVNHPSTLGFKDPKVQAAAERGCHKALQQQAEQLLPQRLRNLAIAQGFSFRQVAVRKLKSRWGSCTAHGDITLNIFLMQLPWPLIDYVLIHELTHTKVLRHGSPFWEAMQKSMPNVAELRRAIKPYQPTLKPNTSLRYTADS